MENSLTSALAKINMGILPKFNAGLIRQKSQWFVGKEITVEGTTVQLCWFGDWKEGKHHFWRSHENTALTPEARKAVDTAIEEQLAETRLAREEEHKQVAKEANALWQDASDLGDHPYIGKKKLSGLHGARVHLNDAGHPVLLVPMRDTSGQLWNITRIYTKKFEGTGSDKFVLAGGRKEGLFHLLGEINASSTIYLSEGFATAATVFEATGRYPTIVCFDAGNLLPVAEAIRAKYPSAKLIFAADNDSRSKLSSGQLYNAGKEKALAAASRVAGQVILPRFTEKQMDSMGEKGPTDWSDLFILAGVKEVSDQLTNPAKQVQEVIPLMPRGKGAKARVSEKDICNALLQYFDGRILRYEHDLFIYRGGFWNLLDMGERDKIKQLICKFADEFGSREFEGAFKYFMVHCPGPPKGVNMFQPTPYAANFENGTLHVIREGSGYRAEFHAHSKEDYLTSKLPFPYPGTPGTPEYKGARNEEFDAMLLRLWAGEEDQGEKIRLYKQVLGACLIPMFPTIVMFIGKPGTGKSTLLKLMAKLVGFENMSNVDPTDFHGFHMETMIGKLVNLNTDIDLAHPISDAMLKKIIDRQPIEIKRKFLKAVKAYLPALHAYAANNLPKTLDGENRAYGRRMIIVQTDKFQAAAGHNLDFDQWLWDQGPDGIICAAVEGFFDLLASGGHYARPASSAARVEEMQDRGDPVAQFLKDVAEGTVKTKSCTLTLLPEGSIDAPGLWSIFKAWRDEEGMDLRNLGRTKFFRSLREKGFHKTTARGYERYHGLDLTETPHSEF